MIGIFGGGRWGRLLWWWGVRRGRRRLQRLEVGLEGFESFDERG